MISHLRWHCFLWGGIGKREYCASSSTGVPWYQRFLVSTGSLIEYAGEINEGKMEGVDEEKPLPQETETTFDIAQVKHVGEFALRKLYHAQTLCRQPE